MFCYNCFQDRPAGPGPCPFCGFDPDASRHKYPLALPGGSILAGQYLVGRPLGQGGFGITYTARDSNSRETVALKEFFPEGIALRQSGTTRVSATSAQQADSFVYGMEKFLDEAQTLARFNGHPNIVGVRRYFEENGTAYFSMEYLEGGSLKEYLAGRGGRLSWEETMGLLGPVFGALETVHRAGIVHRDISPDNIYLCRDGTVKLLDFGAARYTLSDRSQSLSVILKQGFAPVEQYTRRGRQGPWTDVYALAATVYRCVTGQMPPDSVDRIKQDTLAPPSALGLPLPGQAEAALLRGLAVEAEDRWQSADEFRRGLLGQIPVPPSREELRRQAQRQAEEEARRRQEEQERQVREGRERSRLLEQQARQLKKKGRRPVLLAVAAGILIPVLLLAGAVGVYNHLSRFYSVEVRALSVVDGAPALADARETERLLAAGASGSEAGNTPGNLANGGEMTAEGFVALGGEHFLNLYDGRLYYLDLLEDGVWCFDGKKTRCVLEIEGYCDSLFVGPEGLVYTTAANSESVIYHSRWTGDGEPGSPVRLTACRYLSVPVLADGVVYFNNTKGAVSGCTLETGTIDLLIPADRNAHLSFVMDGCLYGWCTRVEELEQEPYIRSVYGLWRYDLAADQYEELLVQEEEISGLNGWEGCLYFLLSGTNGDRLVRFDPADGALETLYVPSSQPHLYEPNLAGVDGTLLIQLKEGSLFEPVLVDGSGRRWPLEELEENG